MKSVTPVVTPSYYNQTQTQSQVQVQNQASRTCCTSRVNSNGTRHSQSKSWRDQYSKIELKIIDLYHVVCVPRGWRPVNKDSQELHEAIDTFQDHDVEWFRKVFNEAAGLRDAGEQDFTAPKGNKLLRILWANY